MISTAGPPNAIRRMWVFVPLAVAGLYALRHPASPTAQDLHVKEILLDEARALLAAGAIVIDVRERAAYEARHLPGAILAPLSTLSAGIPASLSAARTQPVVVYCGDGSTLGPRGTHALNQAGFTQAVNLKPGIQGWADAGLPIEQGAGKAA